MNCDKCTIPIEDAKNRGNWAWDIRDFSYYFCNVFVNLKLLQQKKLFKKIVPIYKNHGFIEK